MRKKTYLCINILTAYSCSVKFTKEHFKASDTNTVKQYSLVVNKIMFTIFMHQDVSNISQRVPLDEKRRQIEGVIRMK